MSSEIYFPAEDSYLMQKVLQEKISNLLKENSDLKVLEIGAGSGIQLVVLQQLGVKNIFSSDINSYAVVQCKNLGFDCIQSDLFEKIKGKYHLIIFNPPYLPDDEREPQESKLATTGGKNGSEIISKFLIQAPNFLKKDGR
ncbi:MAG: HemK2/MTQ2 family protein methyltransferase, partial [Patescibacteria group bacterium]